VSSIFLLKLSLFCWTQKLHVLYLSAVVQCCSSCFLGGACKGWILDEILLWFA
jgi:hypothetical protein